MNFENTWCIIERNQRFETISYQAMSQLPEGSYVMLQNFDTYQEALEEHKRLVKLAIKEMKHKLDN